MHMNMRLYIFAFVDICIESMLDEKFFVADINSDIFMGLLNERAYISECLMSLALIITTAA